VSASWLAAKIRSGHLRWVLVDTGNEFAAPGDTRTGSQAAMDLVAKTYRPVTLTSSNGGNVTLYDCLGRASAILQAAGGVR
jgi:hypothetical protein